MTDATIPATATIPAVPEVKKEVLSPEREKLEVKLKEIEVDQKLHDLDASRKMDELEEQFRTVEITKMKDGEGGWTSPLDRLLAISKAWAIDNERTVIGSEPALKSIWEDHEMEEIKYLIMKKARKL